MTPAVAAKAALRLLKSYSRALPLPPLQAHETESLLASVFGGFLTLGLLIVRQWPLPEALARQPWILKLHDSRSGIPYGVALALGAFILLPHTEIFRLAANA